MAKVILDWDNRTKKAIIISNFTENIRAAFSVPNESKQRAEKQEKPTWYMSDFLSPVSKTGRFEIGLYFDIYKWLKANKEIEFEIETTKILEEKIINEYTWKHNYILSKLNLNYRPYQESSIKRLIHMGCGIVIVGTAGGKTLIMAGLIETIRNYQKTHALVILPATLIPQAYKDFITYGIPEKDILVWKGQQKYENMPVVIVSAETLKSSLQVCSKKQPLTKLKWYKENIDGDEDDYKTYLNELSKQNDAKRKEWSKKKKALLKQLEVVDLLLVDEVHGLREDNAISKTITQINTRHKFGFTGTLPADLMDIWNIKGLLGPVVMDIGTARLRELNYVSDIRTKIFKIHYKNPPHPKINIEKPTEAYEIEKEFLHKNEYRNKIITYVAEKVEKNILIVVNRIEHGEIIRDILKKNTNKEIYFIQGSVPNDEREELRRIMEINDNIICIAMARIFAVGVSINNLHYIMPVDSGKAKVTILQTIGRGLRLHQKKDVLIFIDIADVTPYGIRHLDERIKYYEDEEIKYEIKQLYE
jgi:superfamily II DNA or RNA helicase